MRQTSILAYRSLDASKINERQKQVLLALEEIFPASNREVSDHVHLPINVVTPRMGELVVKGKVEEAYKDRDSRTGRKVIFWRPINRSIREFGDV